MGVLLWGLRRGPGGDFDVVQDTSPVGERFDHHMADDSDVGCVSNLFQIVRELANIHGESPKPHAHLVVGAERLGRRTRSNHDGVFSLSRVASACMNPFVLSNTC